jgi:exosortase
MSSSAAQPVRTPAETPARAASAWPAPSPGLWAGVGLLAVVFGALFFRWFYRQGELSLDRLDDWGHAFVIPVISGYFIWRNRDRLAQTAPRVFWPGLAPFLLGIWAYFFSVVVVRNHMAEGFSVLLALFGLTLLMLGPGVMRWLFLPIAYLVCGVTLAEKIMIEITFQLQLLASEGAWVMLGAIGMLSGFDVDLQGNTLYILRDGETIPLNVAEACSGMRMVVAFYALSVWVALTWNREWWQRIMLVLLAGPVAVFMNMIRVAALGIASLFDAELATGQAHTLIGTLLLVPSLGLYLGIAWVLNRVVSSPDDGHAKPSEGAGA